MATREKLFCDHISADGEPCDKNYSTNRPENLKRHIDEYHLGIKQKCEKCGKEMTISSLIRHKKNGTCLLANTSCDESNDKEIHHSISELSDPNTPNTTELSTHQPDLISVEDHILITKIQMLRFDDGTTQVNPSKSQHIIGESVITVAITYSGKVDIESIHESNAHNELVENDVFLSSNSNEEYATDSNHDGNNNSPNEPNISLAVENILSDSGLLTDNEGSGFSTSTLEVEQSIGMYEEIYSEEIVE